jgi:hypothetical protein
MKIANTSARKILWNRPRADNSTGIDISLYLLPIRIETKHDIKNDAAIHVWRLS